jgi:hypothetical protein
MESGECGDQRVPLLGLHSGQARVAEPGQVGAGLVEGVRCVTDLGIRLGPQCVVPVAVPLVAMQGQGIHLPVDDPDSGLVGVCVELGVHRQPSAGGRRGEAVHDDFVARQGPAAPVHGDVGEQPVLHFVPF